MLPAWEIVGAVFLLGITTFLIIKARNGYPYLTTGWLWYLGTLVPVIGLVQVGVQAMADRYTYVPLIGIAVIVAWGVPELLKKWVHRNAALATMALLILLIFSVIAWKQVQYWQDSITLFTRTLAVTTNNPIMQNNLGNALEDQGRLGEAIAHYAEALRIDPSLADSYNNIGLALTKLGKSDEAVPNFFKAIGINPSHAAAHYNLGTVLASRGKLDEAVYHFRESIRIKPDYAKAYNNLGNVLLIQKKVDEAIDCYREALHIQPDYRLARDNLKDALVRLNKQR
jgi:tetratricopeptide (TPR) repeat protein